MDSLTGQVLIILGIIFSLTWAWNKIRKLEAESRDHFKQIDDLGNQVAGLKRELEEKKVISWEKEKFDKDLDKHIEEITKE
tara:strand:+ start:1485 stop:1727 length:243 start_codon:yes stop_codon:yes gene_type:complete